MDVIQEVEKEIRKRCASPENFFETAIVHIEAVVKNAKELAGIYGADKEIVTIAAWLHDIASITDKTLYEEHHIHGARIAEELLSKLGYEKEKKEKVKNCILNHRGSVLKEKTTPEEICVADADAISHFDSVPCLFYLAYTTRKLGESEGKEFVKHKLERSYHKLSEEGKKIYQEKYEKVMSIF